MSDDELSRRREQRQHEKLHARNRAVWDLFDAQAEAIYNAPPTQELTLHTAEGSSEFEASAGKVRKKH